MVHLNYLATNIKITVQ